MSEHALSLITNFGYSLIVEFRSRASRHCLKQFQIIPRIREANKRAKN